MWPCHSVILEAEVTCCLQMTLHIGQFWNVFFHLRKCCCVLTVCELKVVTCWFPVRRSVQNSRRVWMSDSRKHVRASVSSSVVSASTPLGHTSSAYDGVEIVFYQDRLSLTEEVVWLFRIQSLSRALSLFASRFQPKSWRSLRRSTRRWGRASCSKRTPSTDTRWETHTFTFNRCPFCLRAFTLKF